MASILICAELIKFPTLALITSITKTGLRKEVIPGSPHTFSGNGLRGNFFIWAQKPIYFVKPIGVGNPIRMGT